MTGRDLFGALVLAFVLWVLAWPQIKQIRRARRINRHRLRMGRGQNLGA